MRKNLFSRTKMYGFTRNKKLERVKLVHDFLRVSYPAPVNIKRFAIFEKSESPFLYLKHTLSAWTTLGAEIYLLQGIYRAFRLARTPSPSPLALHRIQGAAQYLGV